MQTRIPPPVLALLAAAAMWALHHWLALGMLVAPGHARWGLLPVTIGVLILLAAMVQFRRARTTVNPMRPQDASHLVTHGIFGRSRNPMYLGLTFMLVGLAVWLGTASPWLVPPSFVAAITWLQIVPEERALGRLFGAEYAAYCAQVGRWLTLH